MEIVMLYEPYQTMRHKRGDITHATTVFSGRGQDLCRSATSLAENLVPTDGPVTCTRCRALLAEARDGANALLGEEE